ncbi:EmrB/QacA subfamily drug resistance transporter [Pseudomonas sp. BIGb0408]|uniref:EmrB/QacA subfamily drug resistance transporter n=2 Tax=Phytopseudomonas flavescens TaxID=29435 RepID=A0A7Y9XRD1_9GAMM|nr:MULTISPECIES: MFS transporter [Pseudomonas]MCW2290658.1 EmrB/QacA subfamily drug resistance transporter [Pseudomonas sp. BIGb0408]NYH74769.1 EmrB/QacA subfamily drug resistance transporter [Pseudomonas flavescens]
MPSSRPRLMLALLACAQLIIALDATILFVALPSIGDELRFSAQQLQWVISAYSVAFGGCLLLGGRCADLLGRRRMYRIGQTLFAVASLAGGCTDSPWLLVLARALQGVGAAMLFPATLALINGNFAEGAARNRALAIWSAASAAGLALGALLGGVLTQGFGWEAVFLVNVPLAGGCAWAAGRWIGEDAPLDKGRSFDLPGAFCVTAGGSLLVLAFIQGPEWGWATPEVVGAFGLAVLLLGLFVWIERRAADPLMHLQLLRRRSLWLAMLITAVFMSSFGVQYYFLAIYYGQVYGFNVLQTGLAFLPATLVCTLGIALAEPMLARFGPRVTLLLGLLAGALGIAWQTFGLVRVDGYLQLLPAITLLSLGQGMTWTAMWVCAGQGIPTGQQGVASGMTSTVQQIGGALGLAILVSVANATEDPVQGLNRALFFSALIAVFGALLAMGLRRPAVQPVYQPQR